MHHTPPKGLARNAALILGASIAFALFLVVWLTRGSWMGADPTGGEPAAASRTAARDAGSGGGGSGGVPNEDGASGKAPDGADPGGTEGDAESAGSVDEPVADAGGAGGDAPDTADGEAAGGLSASGELLVAAALETGTATGLALEFRSLGRGFDAPAEDARRARTAALHVESGAAPSAFLRPGPFRATWRGVLKVEERERVHFAVAGRGKYELRIDDEVVLSGARRRDDEPLEESERLRLNPGEHAVELRYTAPLSGDATVRLLWRGRDFPLEPVPPGLWGYDRASIARFAALRRGRDAVVELGCVQCHVRAGGGGETQLQDLGAPAPSLAAAGTRLRSGWVRGWLLEPTRHRPHPRMPSVLPAGEAGEKAAADLAAWLATRTSDAAPGSIPAGDAAAGASHFARYGCIGCHALEPGDPGLADAERRHVAPVPLWNAGAKFRDGALARFLLDPRAHGSAVRMPNLELEVQEAADLEVFLRARGEDVDPAGERAWPDGDAEAGAALYQDVGCASCHESGSADASDVPSWSALATAPTAGCLADEPGSPAARYAWLDEGEKLAVRAFVVGAARAAAFADGAEPVGPNLERDTPVEYAARQIEALRCAACHTLDGASSRWTERLPVQEELGIAEDVPDAGEAENEVAAEAAGLSQDRPSLTHVGDKLRGPWLAGYLRGDIATVRPWIRAKMPAFEAGISDRLARGLAAMHGRPFEAPEEPAPDPAMVASGRELIESQGGFGCVTCHAVGDRMPTALFEVQGIAFQHVADRLRPEYYHRWMLDPPRLNAAAKMPKYADRRGRTGLPLFGGDAEKQFDAIWAWLRAGDELKD